MASMVEVLKQAGIFMILAQAVLHFCPEPSYEKYFRFILGMMIAIIILVPSLELVQGGIREEYRECLHGFVEKIQEASDQRLETALTPEKQYRQALETKLKDRIDKITEEKGYEVSQVEIKGLGEESEVQGEILLNVLLRKKTEGESLTKIQIDTIQLNRETEKTVKNSRREKEERMRRLLCQELGMEEENVEVTIIEGLE